MHTFVYATPTLIAEALHLVTQVAKAAFNKCYSQIMAYTALAYSYWVSFHDTYVTMPRPCPLMEYRLQLLYNSCRYCLTNHMGSISHHITPLVVNSFGGRHTHIYRHLHRNNFKKPGMRLV